MATVETLTDYQREALDRFLALPGAQEIIQTALVASATGMTWTFLTGSMTFVDGSTDAATLAMVVYGEEAHVYRKAIEGVEQAVLAARAQGAAEAS